MAKKVMTITEGRRELFKIAENVQKPDTHYVVTVEGKPGLVLMSADEYDSIMETMEILSNPETMKNIKKAEKEIARGEYVTWDELKKELNYKESGNLVLADKPKKGYRAISRKKKNAKTV